MQTLKDICISHTAKWHTVSLMNSDNLTTFIEGLFTYLTILILWIVLGSAFLLAGLFHWHSFSVEALSSGKSLSPLEM